MFSLHNESNETLEVIQVIDTSAPGCRVVDKPITEIMEPDDCLCFMGYEPGISYVIRPKDRPEQYRNYAGWKKFRKVNEQSKQESNKRVGG